MPTSTLEKPPAPAATEPEATGAVTPPAPGETKAGPGNHTGARRPRWRRRHYLVDKRFQLQMSFMTVIYVLVPVVAFNVFGAIHSRATLNAIAQTAPQLLDGLARQQRFWSLSVLIMSGLFLVGVLYVRILETHKTAGPAYRLSRALEELCAGKLGMTVTLRKGDNLTRLRDDINALAESLRERERSEIAELERLAARLRTDSPDAAADLERFLDGKRALISS